MQLRPISKELQEIAIKECNEDPKRLEDDVRSIREWIEKQPHLQNRTRTCDQSIVNVLRLHKYRFEVVKKQIDALHTTKAKMPEIFAKRDPTSPSIQKMLKAGACLPLSKMVSPNGPVVVVLRAGDTDLSTVKATDLAQIGTMVLETMMQESDESIISGGHLIVDCQGVTMQDGLRLGLDVIQLAFKLANDSYGLKPKGIYFLNPLPFMQTMFNQVKQLLMKQKIQDRVYFFSNDDSYEKLHQYISPSILPKELGGDSETYAEITEKWKKKVESYRGWFLEDTKYCADLTKRPKTAEKPDAFSMAGSFKKMSID